MKHDCNKLIIYEFEIEAVSPIYFGGSNKGELIKDSEDTPILFGNSIGGALRNYLESLEISKDIIIRYLGGQKGEEFLESTIYISDGNIKLNDKIYYKEGTKINHKHGSAEKNHKYTIEYLPPKTVITFNVECNIQDKYSEEIFNKIIGTWEKGFEDRKIKLGGQQNNGFGEFKLNKLKQKEHIFRTEKDLDRYIFSLYEIEAKSVRNFESYEGSDKKQISFSLSGKFLYGLYQGFVDKNNSELTGLQNFGDKYYLPATSFKGVVKNEIRILLSRFLIDENVILKKLNEMFGDQDQKGKIAFSDVTLKNPKTVKTKRLKKDDNESSWKESSIYIKVDRLTGGVFDGAMIKQREICGDAVLKCILMDFDQNVNPYIFPLIYVLKRIGEGLVPLGGRTSIGLGQFFSTEMELSGTVEESFIFNELDKYKIKKIKNYYDSFERWCRL